MFVNGCWIGRHRKLWLACECIYFQSNTTARFKIAREAKNIL